MRWCPVCAGLTQTVRDNLSQCLHCTHIFQTDLKISVDYAGDYGARTYETYSDHTSYLRAGFVISRLSANGVGTNRSYTHGVRLVDVGYGNGSFLQVMKRSGFDVWGIDVHGKDYGIREITFSTPPVDGLAVATFFDSLEHIPDPLVIAGLRSTFVFVSIPHLPPTFLSDPTTWRHFKPGEHLHYFTDQSLNKLMNKLGYEHSAGIPLEDSIRGRCKHGGMTCDNIHTYCFRLKGV